MTRAPDREDVALQAYADDPMDDGDALLLLDDAVCVELAGLADAWDEHGCQSLSTVLTGAASSSVRLAIARPGAELHAGDYRIWRDLHAALRDSDLELRPLRALPASGARRW